MKRIASLILLALIVTVGPPCSPANAASTANAGVDMTVLTGSLNHLDGFYSSASPGSIASYSWRQTAGPTVVLSNPAAMDPVFQAPSSPTTLTFELTVTDTGGAKSTDSCNVVVVSPTGAAPPDTTSPTVSLTSPASGAKLSGSATLSATANDNVGITKVEFYSGTTLLGTGTNTSGNTWQYSWNTSVVTNGGYSLTARAYDAANNNGTSSAVSVTVSNVAPDVTPPSVTLTSPAAGSTVSGTVTLSATATDNVGVTKVEFYSGTTLLGTGTNTSGTIWQYSWNTSGVTNGSYSLTAKAYDAANNSRTSSAVNVTVRAITPTNKPPVANAGPDQTVRSGSTVSLSGAASTDDSGIVYYRWQRISGPYVRLSGASSVNASFVAPRVTSGKVTLTFRLTVADSRRLSSTDTVTITVIPTGGDD